MLLNSKSSSTSTSNSCSSSSPSSSHHSNPYKSSSFSWHSPNLYNDYSLPSTSTRRGSSFLDPPAVSKCDPFSGHLSRSYRQASTSSSSSTPRWLVFLKVLNVLNSLKTQIFFPFYSMCFLLPFYCSSMLLMSWMGVPKIKIVKQWIWCFNVVYYIKENHLSKLDNYCSAFSRDNDEQKLHKNRLLIR